MPEENYEHNPHSQIPLSPERGGDLSPNGDVPAWLLLVSTVVMLFGAMFLVFHKGETSHEAKNNPDGSAQNTETETAHAEIPKLPSAFEGVGVTAKSAYVLNAKTHEVLFQKNAEAQLPLASLTKLMTAVTAMETIPKYTVVTIDNNSLKELGDSGLKANERFTLKDILNLTLVVSSNDGARAIASVVGAVKNGSASTSKDDAKIHQKTFIAEMNKKAKDIGMAQSYFINETGLDSSDHQSGGYGSAKDNTLLFKYILEKHPDLLSATTQKTYSIQSLDNKKHTVKNTDTIVETIPGIVGSKTGYTDLAGGNLVIGFDASFDEPIIITVLGSTEKERFTDMKKLVDASILELGKNIPKIASTTTTETLIKRQP